MGLIKDANDFLAELEAEYQIRQAILRYFRGADRLDFELMKSAYHDDAYDDHGGYKGDVLGLIEWVKARHQAVDPSKAVDQSLHMGGSSLIEFVDGKAFVETAAILVQHGRVGILHFSTHKPVYHRYTFGVRYVDRFEQRDGQWKIQHRVVVFEWADEQLAELNLGADWETARRSQDDMVFRARKLDA
ncbi:nuclear transport factor 2 family protein [Paraburkholderia caffeinilytica]|uniref:nuclear transport factor 2 family protein n=1 Tax=Paraburkholderia caffeinilytica TaxID=1761016 RepID=UPI0038B9C1E5